MSAPASANAPAETAWWIASSAVPARLCHSNACRCSAGRSYRLAPLQLDAENLGEQVVEAEPLATVVEGEQEEVRAGERLQRTGGSTLLEDRVAQRRAQALEHRRAQHEPLELGVVSREDLAGEEVDDVCARAVERADERPPVRRAGERQRSEVDPGRPALRPGDEEVDVGRRQRELEPVVQELPRLAGREAQVVGAQLDQLAARAERAEREGRVSPRGDDELDRGRQPLD